MCFHYIIPHLCYFSDIACAVISGAGRKDLIRVIHNLGYIYHSNRN